MSDDPKCCRCDTTDDGACVINHDPTPEQIERARQYARTHWSTWDMLAAVAAFFIVGWTAARLWS